mmetsp:Transcript_17496/g.30836  ORF Transcript_17496/g.30836 Transcript_17496/m.30836 type:complete len:389 (-) Transcript_17496:79-1245(-)
MADLTSPPGSPTSTPALPVHMARAVTIDEARFLRARDRRVVGMPRESGREEEEYTFVQLADTQFGMLPYMQTVQWLRHLRKIISLATCGLQDGKDMLPIPLLDSASAELECDELLELEIEYARKTVSAINALRPKPRFVVVCGDLVNAYPDKDPELNAAQVKIFKEVFSQVDKDIVLVCTCGNHDVGEKPSPGSLALWQKRFGDDYYSFWVGEDKYIVLNSQLYKHSSSARLEAEDQDIWLDEELFEDQGSQTERKARHKVVFSHIPPFIQDVNEPSGYFPLAKKVRQNLLNRMAKAGVSHWFCGHFHRNVIGRYKDIEVVTTGAVGGNLITDPAGDLLGLSGMDQVVASENKSGLRIVRVSAKGITHEYKTLAELKPRRKSKSKSLR